MTVRTTSIAGLHLHPRRSHVRICNVIESEDACLLSDIAAPATRPLHHYTSKHGKVGRGNILKLIRRLFRVLPRVLQVCR